MTINASGKTPVALIRRNFANNCAGDLLTVRATLRFLARQQRGAAERVVLFGERPLAQTVKSFELADPITLPFISPESRFDLRNLIARLGKRF